MFKSLLSEVFTELGLGEFDLEVYQKILNTDQVTATVLSKSLS